MTVRGLPVCLALLFAASLAASSEAQWKAGVARRVITPKQAVWLAGYGTKRPPDGKLHDLWMKALALEDERGRRVVLITSDFQGVPKSMSDLVFARLEKEHQLQRHQVMFTFSHNHCGPRLGDDLVDYYPVDEEQVKLVEQYTAKDGRRMQSAWWETRLRRWNPPRCRWARVRPRSRSTDAKTPRPTCPSCAPEGMLKGPVDHAVPVLTVTRVPDGKLEAVLFGYACHPTTLSFKTWCGDYPGFAQLQIERDHPGTTAMFVNTCGGDQNPLPRRSVELCEKYGRMLALAVEQTLKRAAQAGLAGRPLGVCLCRPRLREGRRSSAAAFLSAGRQRDPSSVGRPLAAAAGQGREVLPTPIPTRCTPGSWATRCW